MATCTLFARDLLFCCDAKNIILPIFLQIMARFRRYLISEYFCKNDHRDGETLTQSVPVLSWLPISAAVNRGYSLVSIAAVIIASVCFILCFFLCQAEACWPVAPCSGQTLHLHLQDATSTAVTAGEPTVCLKAALEGWKLWYF